MVKLLSLPPFDSLRDEVLTNHLLLKADLIGAWAVYPKVNSLRAALKECVELSAEIRKLPAEIDDKREPAKAWQNPFEGDLNDY